MFFAGFFFYTGAGGAGFVFLVMFALNLWYIYSIRNRIEFTAILLETVVAFLTDFPGSIYLSFIFVFVQVRIPRRV